MSTVHDDIFYLCKELHDIDNIELPKRWFSLAFNRLLHDNFAPKFMWDALFEYCRRSGDLECYIGEEDFFLSHDKNEMDKVLLSETSVISYLVHDFRFTRNYVLISLSKRWAVRLDQDVIYFLFRVEDKDYIFKLFGGFDNVENMMLNEFDGVKGRAGAVEKYVSALLKNI
ncbi:hypothetical protein [Arsukibacterium sp.]|uniref:hypothetical protein n=1 Tax=Arsukibacterium sp. TaxID=1977258 RepID=UPI00299D1716|nr:hypothetical protein [Arsukibacterium sp.]MDX1536649.1 hypothetical protein [Arsukibacterium sp.]